MPPGGGVELDRVVESTTGSLVPEQLRRFEGLEGKSLAKEQAS